MIAEIKTNKVFNHLHNSTKRITVEQGGARSGKTYNILIWFIIKLLNENNKVLTIARKTLPSLKASVLRDFINILEGLGIYNPDDFNKTEHIYHLNGNIIEFVSVDMPQKIRGRKRDYLFANEANELNYDDWYQLLIRTTDKTVIDFNPSISEDHWIYTQVKSRNDADFHITTYKDNPFLEQTIINEIERLQFTDQTLWNIYGLGLRSDFKGLIFQNWDYTDIMPSGKSIYGLDFGFTNDPSALVQLTKINDIIYLNELIYETHLTNSDLINKFKDLNIDKTSPIYCDSAEPKSIYELQRAGYNAKPVKKGSDSIRLGIDVVKRYQLRLTNKSYNLAKELKNYKYKEMNGNVTNDIATTSDHAIDAMRYAISMEFGMDKINRFRPIKARVIVS